MTAVLSGIGPSLYMDGFARGRAVIRLHGVGRVPDIGMPILSTIPAPRSTKLVARIARNQGTIRPLDPSDPRSLDHPSHKEQWLGLARALGRLEAREDFERLQRKEQLSNGVLKTKARHPS